MGHPPTRRRPLLLALAGGAAAVTGIGAAARTGLLGGDDDPDPRGLLELSSGDMGVQSLRLPLTGDVLSSTGSDRWQSRRLDTTTYSMVGFTWRAAAGAEPEIEISSRRGGAWREWQPVPHVHESPDPAEGGDTVGTDLVWVGPTEGIRIRLTGKRPAGLALVLLHPEALPGDAMVDLDQPLGRAATAQAQKAAANGKVPRPQIRNRKEWGANENLRDKPPRYTSTIQQIHVHHTVNSNDYSRDEVPALMRGMYAYHTQSLGWSDIGYNFLVDRFGRIWMGRAGGASKNVHGAHTLGFNTSSAGVSVIGNFDKVKPPAAVINAIARVAAWKLSAYGRDPMGRVTLVSEGSDKFRSGSRVTLPVIDGHRDTNDTSCPGTHLYAALPAIRKKTRTRMDNFAQVKPRTEITEPFRSAGQPIEGRELRVRPGSWSPAAAAPRYTWLRDGAAIAGATGTAYRLTAADVGRRVSVRVDVTAADTEAASQTVAFGTAVKAKPALVVKAAGRKGGALVRVVASAALPAGYPTGSVLIKIAGRRRTVPLVDGRARTRFSGLEPGTYDVTAVFAGNTTAAQARATSPVTVKPRG